VVEPADQTAIAILIDLNQIDTASDHVFEGGGGDWAVGLIPLGCVYTV
jgi:hypothetical protein